MYTCTPWMQQILIYMHLGRDLRNKLNESGNTSTNDQQLVHFNVEKFLNN